MVLVKCLQYTGPITHSLRPSLLLKKHILFFIIHGCVSSFYWKYCFHIIGIPPGFKWQKIFKLILFQSFIEKPLLQHVNWFSLSFKVEQIGYCGIYDVAYDIQERTKNIYKQINNTNKKNIIQPLFRIIVQKPCTNDKYI